MNYIKLTHDRLDVGAINELAANETCGAIAHFVGITRNNFDGKKVVFLEYESYDPMATKEIESICEKIRRQWPDVVHIVIYHRLGLVPVKEASVVIAISSPHRKSALEAVSFAIEELKSHVPIWKKEMYEHESESEWKANKESNVQRAKRTKIASTECGLGGFEILPSNLVQITATQMELDHRIDCFLKKKRDEINQSNIADFIHEEKGKTANDVSTCARVNSFMDKQGELKGHLRVRRVKNRYGPQTQKEYIYTLDKLMLNSPSFSQKGEYDNDKICTEFASNSSQLFTAAKERIVTIEEQLKMSIANKKNIFERLKAIEDRILQLESISPEYKHFLSERPAFTVEYDHELQKKRSSTTMQPKPKAYTLKEIDTIIESFKN